MTEKRFTYLFGLFFQNKTSMTSYEVLNTLNEQNETIQHHIKFIRECAEKQGFDSVDDFLNVIHNGRITAWSCKK